MQQEKEQLLAEHLKVKEEVNRALRSVTGLELQAKDRVTHQVEHLAEAVQQLQQRITYLELCTIPDTPEDVRDQREATARSTVERIKFLALECKQLSDCSAQMYEQLTEDPKLKALES
jgi:hypothetical protein